MQHDVLDRLWVKLRELGSGDAVLLAVPGNHDLYRPNQTDDNAARDILLARGGFDLIANRFWDDPSVGYRRVIKDAFAPYEEWWNSAPQRPKSQITNGILPGDFGYTLQCGDYCIGIVGLNTTFLQLQAGDYRKRLVWDARQLHTVTAGAVDDWVRKHHIRLLLTHQGPDWLTPASQKQGDSEIAPAGRFAIHLYGHMHETKIVYFRSGGGDAIRRCQARSVFGMDLFGEPPRIKRAHGYTVGRIDFRRKSAVLRLWPRKAIDDTGAWRFIADQQGAELNEDGGTKRESIAINVGSNSATSRASSPKASRARLTAGAHAITLTPFIPHSTLPVPRPFFGREKELEAVAKVLRPEHVGWGVVLDGPGGMGKTALAVEAAHRAPTEHYPLKLFITAKERYLEPGGERQQENHHVQDFFCLALGNWPRSGTRGRSARFPGRAPRLGAACTRRSSLPPCTRQFGKLRSQRSPSTL